MIHIIPVKLIFLLLGLVLSLQLITVNSLEELLYNECKGQTLQVRHEVQLRVQLCCDN